MENTDIMKELLLSNARATKKQLEIQLENTTKLIEMLEKATNGD